MKTKLFYAGALLVIHSLLFTSCAVIPKSTSVYHGNSNYKAEENHLAVKKELTEILKRTYVYNKNVQFANLPKEVTVANNIFEVEYKDKKITINIPEINEVSILDWNKANTLGLGHYRYSVEIQNTIFSWQDIRQAQVFADAVAFLHQKNLYDQSISSVKDFEPVAAEYRKLKVKPPVSEEQRKYVVQANSLNQQKMYVQAIELYKKATDLDQTAYPAAYSNLALLSAHIRKFDAAIYYMKKYLLLEPEAKDARGAQDKIYEWEILIQK